MENYKEVANSYLNDQSAKLGVVDTSTVSRWTDDSKADSKWIDQTVTKTNTYDSQFRALNQFQDISTFDHASSSLKLSFHNEIDYSIYDNRNDAGVEALTSYRVPDTGLKDKILIDYKVMTNRTYDPSHNIVNQMVATYSTSDTTKPPLTVEEIRSSNFDSTGMAKSQVIVTYSDLAKTKQVGVKEIDNSGFSSVTNTGTRVITDYSLVTLSGDLATCSGEISRQIISVTSADNRGNALEETILSEGYVAGAFVFSGCQEITTLGSDINRFDQATHSVVKNYSSALENANGAISTSGFLTLEDTYYTQYDKFGNVLGSNTHTYTDLAKSVLENYKEVANSYLNDQAAKLGVVDTSTVSRWTDDTYL